MSMVFETDFVARVLWPLIRLLVVMSVGLLVANLIEALHWTRFIAKVTTPLARLGRLHATAGASFSLAFFSPAAANALLAEAYQAKKLTRRELVFANLFNSTPTYLVHLPTLFSLVYAFLGVHAVTYIAVTFFAAMLRTGATLLCGRLFLPVPIATGLESLPGAGERKPWRSVVRTTITRFKKRIGKLLEFTIPCYLAVYAMQQYGWFSVAEKWMAAHMQGISWIRPEMFGIIALHMVAESGAALSAAASLLHTEALVPAQVIFALLIGNIISSPMRAFRHQFPSYAGYFTPSLAFFLVVMNQLCRVASLVLVTILYYAVFMS